MSDSKEHKGNVSEGYKEAREAFESLNIEEKAIFLVEGAVHTIARGIQDAFHALSVEVNSCFDHEDDENAAEEAASAEAEEAPEPEAAKPAPAKKKAPAKKTAAAKRTTSRRTSTKRTASKKTDTDSDTADDADSA